MRRASYTRLKERRELGLPPLRKGPSKLQAQRRYRAARRRRKRELMRTWLALPGIKQALAVNKRIMGTIEHLLQLTDTTQQQFIEVLDRARDEHDSVAVKFFTLWEQLTLTEQHTQSLDGFCKLVKLKPSALVGVFVEHICRLKQHAAIIKAAMALDSIVDASVEFARAKDGIDDRRILLKNQKFIDEAKPSPTVVIDQRQQSVVMGERSFEAVIKGLDEKPLLNGSNPVVVEAEVVEVVETVETVETVTQTPTLEETNA